jgi:hypothetical protein
VRPDETILWTLEDGTTECAMISCCTGAELRVRRRDAIVLRELYPDTDTLYERARSLQADAVRRSGAFA